MTRSRAITAAGLALALWSPPASADFGDFLNGIFGGRGRSTQGQVMEGSCTKQEGSTAPCEASNPDSPAALIGQAKDDLKARQPAEAEKKLDRALSLEPENAEALSLRSSARMVRNDMPGAYEDAKKALTIDPKNKLAGDVAGLAGSYMRGSGKSGVSNAEPSKPAGEFDRAPARPSQDLRPAERPKDASFLRIGQDEDVPLRPIRFEAKEKMQLGDLKGALLAATRAIEAARSDPDAWALRAEIGNKRKNYAGALSDADEALKLRPDDPAALRERGYANLNLGNASLALADLDRAIGLDPSNAAAYLYRAMAKEKLGDAEGARKDYEKAAALDPALIGYRDEAQARREEFPAPAAAQAPPSALIPGLAVGSALLLAAAGAWLKRKRAAPPPAAPPAAPAAPETATEPATERLPRPAPPPALSLPAEAPPAEAGRQGQYELRGEIGRGGMGRVYEAFDRKLDRKVAVKVLREELVSDARERERFLAEARIISHLAHPFIVGIHDIYTEEGTVRLVFDYVEGTTLHKLIREKKGLSLAECKKVFGQVCEAIEFAHENRVLHRDLKPANIMVDRSGFAKVMDFGLAREAKDRLTKLTSVDASGTPLYMAPEQHVGKAGKASDVYALGVCLYEALTGTAPFEGSDLLACKQRAEYAPPSARVRGLPRKADQLIAMLLAPDPAKRIASAKGMGLILAGL